MERHEHSQNRIDHAALIDANVVPRENQKNIIDKNELKRQMTKYQEDIRKSQLEKLKLEPPVGIYVDGGKDDTLTLEKDDRGIWKVVQYN